MKTKNPSHPAIDVRTYRASASKGNLLAFASVTLDNCFAVNGIQIVDGKNGIFVAMPSFKDKKGEYRDICFPVTAEFRATLHEAIIAEYEQSAALGVDGQQ